MLHAENLVKIIEVVFVFLLWYIAAVRMRVMIVYQTYTSQLSVCVNQPFTKPTIPFCTLIGSALILQLWKRILQVKIDMFQSSSRLVRMASTHRARKRIREAKRKARPELATREMWVQNDYANTFDLSWERVTSPFTNPLGSCSQV